MSENRVLIVVDMQNDFIDGSLGTREAAAIVPKVVKKISEFQGKVYYTQDTHYENYLETAEGKKLPVLHCIKGTEGHRLNREIEALCKKDTSGPVEKLTFGSVELAELLKKEYASTLDEIELVGLCTDICVISNTLILKAYFPEVRITVDASCCAGVTPESHKNALNAMKMCHIDIMNED
ncbi:MAG TPA: isochorismatase family cysteine hydrolase [Mobilitalea sp.]|nr:isochorismatase family cysteine hydrolase [Mobilitalea sp.]